MGDLFSAFRGTKEGQSILSVPAVSQVTLIQINKYAKVAYFGITYSAPLHLLSFSCPGLLLSKGLLELEEREAHPEKHG